MPIILAIESSCDETSCAICKDGEILSNIIANQSLLNEEAPLAQKGVSFGLYRTAAYIGAILSGTRLKTAFQNGVTDQSFHHIGYYMAVSAIVLLVLLLLVLTLLLLREKDDTGTRGRALYADE